MTYGRDRIWLLGGVVTMIVLIAGGWFLLISPKNAQTDDARSRTADGTAELILLKRQAAMLKAENAKLPAYTAQLATNRQALPATSGVPDFMRQLQDSGTAVGVEISGISVGGPQLSKSVPTVYELPISLSAKGSAATLSEFLDRLQNIQPRAVLVVSVTLTSAPPADVIASISLLAFVSPQDGADAPTVTPS
jgi:Tfp pilus assembly protein PilO